MNKLSLFDQPSPTFGALKILTEPKVCDRWRLITIGNWACVKENIRFEIIVMCFMHAWYSL